MKLSFPAVASVFILLLGSCQVYGLHASATNKTQTVAAAKIIAQRIISYYQGGQNGDPVGLFPKPYTFYDSAIAWISLIDYLGLSNDTTYNKNISNALAAQLGPNLDFQPADAGPYEANDAQAMWALLGLSAVAQDLNATLALTLSKAAVNVFNDQVARWSSTCGGGIGYFTNSGNSSYGYKQTITQGHLFTLAANIANSNKNATMARWAEKIYDWLVSSGLITSDYQVLDGIVFNNGTCSIVPTQWTVGYGWLAYGSAVMYNYTKSAVWEQRASSFISTVKTNFSQNGILYEPNCESQYYNCTDEQKLYKGVTAAIFRDTENWAPGVKGMTLPFLQTTLQAALDTCTGGTSGNDCGYVWTARSYQGDTGLSAEIDVMSSIASIDLPFT